MPILQNPILHLLVELSYIVKSRIPGVWPLSAEEIIIAHFPMKMPYICKGMLGAQFATLNKFSRTVDNLACAVYADSVLTNSKVTQPRAQQFEAHGPSLAPRVVLVNREAFVEGVEQTVEASSSPFFIRHALHQEIDLIRKLLHCLRALG
jgi:hypothetical protein